MELIELQFLMFKHLLFKHNLNANEAGPLSKTMDENSFCTICNLKITQLSN